jgi:hypothetical protein
MCCSQLCDGLPQKSDTAAAAWEALLGLLYVTFFCVCRLLWCVSGYRILTPPLFVLLCRAESLCLEHSSVWALVSFLCVFTNLSLTCRTGSLLADALSLRPMLMSGGGTEEATLAVLSRDERSEDDTLYKEATHSHVSMTATSGVVRWMCWLLPYWFLLAGGHLYARSVVIDE